MNVNSISESVRSKVSEVQVMSEENRKKNKDIFEKCRQDMTNLIMRLAKEEKVSDCYVILSPIYYFLFCEF